MTDDKSIFRISKHQYDFEIDCSKWCPDVPAETADDVVFVPGRFFAQKQDTVADEQWASAEKSWPPAGEPAELHLTLRVLDVETLGQLKVVLDSLKTRGLQVDDIQISASH